MRYYLLAAFLFLFVTPAQGEVILNVKTEHYAVPGKTKNDILRNMQQRSHFKIGTSFVPAYTETDIRIQYSLEQRGSRCSTKDVKVILNLTYTYPQLAQYQPSAKIRFWWRDIIKAYTIHEEIHGDISTRWAHELDRELRSLRSLNCSSANEIIQAKYKAIMDNMRDEQEAYDEITQHGNMQHRYKGPSQ